MTKLQNLGALSLGRLQAVVFAFVGLIAGIGYAFGGLVYDLVTTGSVNAGTALAFLALIGMPAMFAAFGFVTGVIAAPAYNLFARRFGGIEIGNSGT